MAKNETTKPATNAVSSMRLLEILKDYTCQYHQDEDNDALQLVDVLCHHEDDTVNRGKMEMELLAEHIAECLSND